LVKPPALSKAARFSCSRNRRTQQTAADHASRLLRDGDRYLIIASVAGAPRHPPWFFNVRANPVVTLEVDAETFQATSR